MTGPAEIVFTGQWDEDRSP